MKIGLLSCAIIALTAVSAGAGGFTSPIVEQTVAPALPVAPEQASNWSGGYVGGNLSWSKSKVKATNSFYDAASEELSDLLGEPVDLEEILEELNVGRTLSEPDGIGGAIRAGYDWQSGNVVYGLGGEYNLGKIDAGLERDWRDLLAAAGDELGEDIPDIDVEISNAATLFGRIGYAAGDWMPYALVGYTWADGEISALGESVGADLKGPTIGLGAERRFSNNWTGYGEWTYTDFGDVKDAEDFIEVDMHQLKLGVNYRF